MTGWLDMEFPLYNLCQWTRTVLSWRIESNINNILLDRHICVYFWRYEEGNFNKNIWNSVSSDPCSDTRNFNIVYVG